MLINFQTHMSKKFFQTEEHFIVCAHTEIKWSFLEDIIALFCKITIVLILLKAPGWHLHILLVTFHLKN